MTRLARPDNYVHLLSEVVAASRNSRFWREKLGDRPVRSLVDFETLPFTSVEEYRAQAFESVVADPAGIEWIPGPWLGQSPGRVPMAEGPAEARIRVDLMADALTLALPSGPSGSSSLVVVDIGRRHFGAEVCSVFVRMGIRAHLITEDATDRMAGLLGVFVPDVLVALTSSLDLQTLPDSVTGVITAECHAMLEGRRHVDLLIQSELGVLGFRTVPEAYVLNHHRFHIEKSPTGTLAVTPYYSRVQPVIRLDTGIAASVLN